MNVIRKARRSFPAVLLSLLAMALVAPGGAAAASRKGIGAPPRTNILMICKEGEAIDPVTLKLLDKPGGYEEYDRYIDAIFHDLTNFCVDKRPCKVLFFFHGGLNGSEDSVARAAKLTDTIKAQGIYPIFVNWNSSLVSTWWDHVAHVHKGLWQGNRYVAAVPYFMLVDEAKSIAEAPTAWVAEARHTFPHEQGAGAAALQTYHTLVREHQANPQGTLVLNDLMDGSQLVDDRKPWEIRRAKGKLLYSWWSKLLSPPLIIQAAGTGAWDMMQRRTAMLFRTEAEFRGASPEAVAASRTDTSAPAGQGEAVNLARQYDTGAALAHFISRFQQEFLPQFCGEGQPTPEIPGAAEEVKQATPKEHEEGAVACEQRLQVTLVGHSMGTIIVDRLLRYAPNLKVKNIVFMAAASTVEDYRDTVDAYLDRHKDDRNGGTNMYHLVLHPLAEVTEQGFLDLSPRGSLLVWIDNYFTDPPTPLGRRVGRFPNVVPELRFAGHDTRSHVYLKVFRVGKHLRCWNPQKHGDFGAFPFWDERFWNPAEPSDETSSIRRQDRAGCPAEEQTAAGKASASAGRAIADVRGELPAGDRGGARPWPADGGLHHL